MSVDLSEIEGFGLTIGPPCAVGTLLAGKPWRGVILPEGGRDMLREALPQRDRFSSVTLSEWLKSKDVDLGDSAINRHRNGTCRCART